MPYKNKENEKKRSREYYKNNKENKKKYNGIYYKNNKDKIKEQVRQWRENNLEKVREYKKQWRKNKRRTDLKYNLNRRMVSAIGKSLKGNKAGRSWESLVGYTLKDLIKHLQKTLPKGYTWQDYFNGKLHIDHIIPISAFNFTKPEHLDFKKCWALSNLQILTAKENIMKHTKLSKPFQPALQI